MLLAIRGYDPQVGWLLSSNVCSRLAETVSEW